MAWMNSTDLDSNFFGQIENTMSNACGCSICNMYLLAGMAGAKELPSTQDPSEIFYMHFISLIPSNGYRQLYCACNKYAFASNS